MEKLIEIKNTVTLQVLDCANCASKIESKINDLPEIQGASVDFINASCTYITNDSNNDKVLDSIKKIVNELEPDVRVITEEVKEEEEEDFKGKKIQILAGVVLIIIGFIVRSYSDLFGSIFFVASYLLLGYEVIVKAVKNLLKGNLFDENFLMAIATIVAIFLQEYLEAAAVMVFYQFGELFQDQAVATSRSNIASLMDIRPDYANVIRNNEVETINPELVKINEVVVVKPGEKIPLDGVVIEGSSMLDTSSLTGESLAFEAEVGTNVISGCVNLDGILKVKVTKPYGESTVNKILELVENTSSRKANAEKFITKFSKVYTPVVVISAALLALLLPLFINIPYSESIRRAATFLIISCPCALVLSIPLGFYAGIGSLSKIGILVKGSTIVESLSKVKRVVLDKTGTLTEGKFFVEKTSGEDTLRLAAYAEHNSIHPIAKSIVHAFNKEIDASKIIDVKEHVGFGVEVTLDEGVILVGNKKLMQNNGIDFNEVNELGSVVYVSKNNEFVGYILITDRIKNDSKQAISDLKKLNIDHIVMLTGDNEKVANNVGKQLGISEIYANNLPDQKVSIVKGLLDEDITAFVGDGINDAPVLALADVGFAMGGLGSDAAIEAADVVIMDDKPSKIAVAIKQSKKTMNVIVTNIVFAIAVKVLVLILGGFGIANMWLAVFADVGVSILCIINSVRLLNIKY